MSGRPANDTPLTEEEGQRILEAEAMIQRNAAWIARHIPGAAHEDLAAVGRLAAAGPARTFDVGRNIGFEHYAYKAVHGAMVRAALKGAPFTQAQRELILRMIDGVPEARRDDAEVSARPSERLRAEEEEHDAIGAGLLLGAASGERADPEAIASNRSMLAALDRFRHKLPDQEQRIVEMHYFEDVALEKVGETLGLSRTTIKARHRKALVRLRAFMDAWK